MYRGPPDKTVLNRQPTSSDLIKQLVFGQDHPGRNASVSLKVAKRRRERRREGMGSKEKKSDDNKTHTIAKAGVGWGANMLPPCRSRPSKLARPFSSPVPSWPGLIPKSVVLHCVSTVCLYEHEGGEARVPKKLSVPGFCFSLLEGSCVSTKATKRKMIDTPGSRALLAFICVRL